MDCGANTTRSLQDDTTRRGIEIIPEGCQAVSEDVCASGYMAPADNVSFPENSLKQCCKCKDDQSCGYCADPDACTTEEKLNHVTSENCFGITEGTTAEDTTEDTTEDTPEDTTEDTTEDTSYTLYLIMFFVIMSLLVITFLMTRKSLPNY
jgi:hypothetical protein